MMLIYSRYVIVTKQLLKQIRLLSMKVTKMVDYNGCNLMDSSYLVINI